MIFPVLIVIVLAVAFLSLATGSAPVAVLPGLSDWLLGINSPAAMVIGDIRLPRTLLSLTVGASLGLSGAALQGLLRNPLADPSLTGASQGAALGLRRFSISVCFPSLAKWHRHWPVCSAPVWPSCSCSVLPVRRVPPWSSWPDWRSQP